MKAKTFLIAICIALVASTLGAQQDALGKCVPEDARAISGPDLHGWWFIELQKNVPYGTGYFLLTRWAYILPINTETGEAIWRWMGDLSVERIRMHDQRLYNLIKFIILYLYPGIPLEG